MSEQSFDPRFVAEFDPQFDPYGERIAGAKLKSGASESGSALTRLGTGLFWTLVIVIVAARAFLTNPAPFVN